MNNSHPEPSVPSIATRGAALLGAAQFVKLGVTILSTVIIARLLTPSDYGVIAMLAPVAVLILMFQDLGLSTATIQKATLSGEESNAMFWLNLLASIALAGVLVACAPLVAWFYEGDYRVGYVTAASALPLIVGGLTLQHGALLNREMRFAWLSAIDVANAVAAFLATALLAWWLRSYWALMLGTFAGVIVQSAMLWGVCRFRPAWPPTIRAAKSMMRTGCHVTGFNLVNFLVRNADTVLVARFSGAVAAGLYDRSYRLLMLPIQNINTPINRVLLPLLSRNRDMPQVYRRYFLLAARGVMLASAPAIAVSAATSAELMPFLLGDKWGDAGPIYFWLGLAGLLQPVANLTGVLYISNNQERRMMHWGIASAIVTLVAFVIGLRWGAEGVAAAFFWSALLRMPALYWIAAKDNAVRAIDLWRAQLEPLVGAVVAAVIAYRLLGHWSLVSILISTIPSAYLLSLASSMCLSSDGRNQTRELLSITTRFVAHKLKR